MSIEIVGPEKYRFQDRVCAILALLYSKDRTAKLEIEPDGGEDAQLSIEDGGRERVVEVQVKGAKRAVDEACLADWLSHFPPNSAKNPLIERLIKDKNRVVLVVATGRCNDAMAAFHADIEDAVSTSLERITVGRKQVVTIRDAVKGFSAKSAEEGSIDAKRRSYIGAYLATVNESTLKSALKRLIIVDELGEDDVKQQLKSLLLVAHEIVPDLEYVTTAKLVEAVFDHKRQGADVLPRCRDIIQDARPENPLRPRSYTLRGDEDALMRRLQNESVLLLAGPPRTGKTTTAHWLAAELQKLGFEVDIKENISAASRYLLAPIEQPRVAVVDDPFGGIRIADDASHELAELEFLIGRMRKGKRLIVAQAQDRLFEVTREPSIQRIETQGVRWVELSMARGTFLSELWRDATSEGRDVPTWLFDTVLNALEGGHLDLEPGCLTHLAHSCHRLEKDANLPTIKRLAQEDAKSLGRALHTEGMSPLVQALAVSTTADHKVSARELAFAMGSGGPERPGKSNVVGTMIHFGADSPEEVPQPQYYPEPVLDSATVSRIDALELRRIVEVTSSEYTFTHPQYRASAELLLDAATNLSEQKAIKLVERCLFSLSAKTSEATAKNLSWLYERLESESGRNCVINIARDGLKSIFPSTSDQCFRFLTKGLANFPAAIQGELGDWVNRVTQFDIDEFEWIDGEPRLPAAGPNGIIEHAALAESAEPQDIEATLRALEASAFVPVPPEMAAVAATFYSQHPQRLTTQSAGRLLSYDIAVLRAPVAGAWLTLSRDEDTEILDRIFTEEHPAAVAEVLRAVCVGWWEYSKSRQEVLKMRLVAMAESPIVAAAMIRQLVRFDRAEYVGSPSPWVLFESLMPRVMGMLPLGAALDGPHLYNVVVKALNEISQDSVLQIVDRWIERLLREVDVGRVPNEYMLGVTSVLLRGTKNVPQTRKRRVDTLLRIPGTQSRIRVIEDLVDHWSGLTPDEQHSVLDAVLEERTDGVWLRAAALTRRVVPDVLQHRLLPSGITLNVKPTELLLKLPRDLLYAVVHLASAWHPRIDNMCLQGKQGAWIPVIGAIARNPQHDLFDVAIDYAIKSSEERDLIALIDELGPRNADRIFDRMLGRKLQTSGDFMRPVWSALFNQARNADTVEHWIEAMADAALSVLDDLNEVEEWIPAGQLEAFNSHFVEDYAVMRLLISLHGAARQATLNDENKERIAHIIKSVIDAFPPKHWSTYEFAEKYIRRMGVRENPLLNDLENKRKAMYEAQSMRPLPEFSELDHWVPR
jgi:DNA polymerase III delta prime subunit